MVSFLPGPCRLSELIYRSALYTWHTLTDGKILAPVMIILKCLLSAVLHILLIHLTNIPGRYYI